MSTRRWLSWLAARINHSACPLDPRSECLRDGSLPSAHKH